MAPRIPEIRSYRDALNLLRKRVRKLEDQSRNGTLPKGYQFQKDGAGNIVIVRTSDGATGTVTLT